MVHEPGEQLHGQILERQGRAMEQLEDERAGTELDQRHDRGMAERPIGLGGHAGEVVLRDRAVDERAQDFERQLRVRQAGQAGDSLRSENRPEFGHIEPAIAGEPGQHRLDEIERRSLAAGGNVVHRPILRVGRTLCGRRSPYKKRRFDGGGHRSPVSAKGLPGP